MASEDVNNIEWIKLDIPGKGEQEFCSLKDARTYLGLSSPGLNLILNDQQITRWKFGQGTTKYLSREDVEKLKRQREQLHASNEPRISSKQLLQQASVLLERVQAGHADTEAIAKWLEMYQEAK